MAALRDIMTSDVFSVSRDTPVAEAARAMVKGGFGSAIVKPGARTLGILTERDVLRVTEVTIPTFTASSPEAQRYSEGLRRSLNDPGKSRFHDKEKQLLAAIEAEIARQKGGGGGENEPPPPGDEDAPF